MTSKIVVNNIEADAGISTVTFASEVTAPTFNGNIVGTSATFSGNVNVAGVLTYEDVTSVDAVGLSTFQNGIHVTGGSVGIGTDNPLRKLDILGTGRPVEIGSTNATNIVKLYNSATGKSTYNGVDIQSNSTAGGIISAYGGYLDLRTSSSNGSDATSRLRITGIGSIGIGTATPGAGTLIDIAQEFGRTRITKYGHIISQNIGPSSTDYWTLAPRTSGEFDIGRGTPDSNGTIADVKLQILSTGEVSLGAYGAAGGFDTTKAIFSVGNSTANAGNFIRIGKRVSTTETNLPFITHGSFENDGNDLILGAHSADGRIRFYTGASNSMPMDGTNDERMCITQGGSIGINTTAPQSRLEVFTDNDTDFGNSSNTNNTNSLIRLFNKNGTDNTAVNNYVGIRFDVANGATSTGYLSYVRTGNNAGAFQFKARNGASSYPEVARILSSGGITFGGDTAQDNALDDYEEGTLGWRLQRTGAIGSGSNASDTSIRYTKIGNRVYVSGYLYTQNTGATTGVTVELRDDSNTNNVATLPYEPNQAGGFPITGTRTISDAYRNMAVTFRQGQSQVYIYTDDGNNSYLKNTNNVQINSTQTHLVIQFCGSYTTNS